MELTLCPQPPHLRSWLAINFAGNCGEPNIPMMTQGEMEAAVCEGISKFEVEYMGRGPKDISCFLINDLLLIRLQGVLTAAEQHLVQTQSPERGRDLLKDVRTQLIEIARPTLETLIENITDTKVISLHHDISTVSGEEVIIFSLDSIPVFRQTTNMVRETFRTR